MTPDAQRRCAALPAAVLLAAAALAGCARSDMSFGARCADAIEPAVAYRTVAAGEARTTLPANPVAPMRAKLHARGALPQDIVLECRPGGMMLVGTARPSGT